MTLKQNPNDTAKYHLANAAQDLREVRHYGFPDLDAAKIRSAHDAIGRALDALGVPRLKPEHCKHPEELRQRIDSSTDRCGACNMLYAMVAGKSGIRRKWIPGDKVELAQSGHDLTQALLENEREKARAAAEAKELP